MTLLRLSHVGPTSRAPSAAVARRGGKAILWAELVRDVEALACELARHGAGRWLLFADDTYAFAVGLIALWQSGSTAVVPPNIQAGTLSELGPGTRGAVTDRQAALGGEYPVLRPGQAPRQGTWSWQSLDEQAPRLELFTSGTTGSRKPIPKALSHLAEEVDRLDRQWGTLVEGRQILATVSHHHIYGLLFRLLWPLCGGRVFDAETYVHADELVPRMLEADEASLVTSPVHLRRLVLSEDFRKLGRACRPIFSSGGPLDESTADIVAEAFGHGAIEIFGSTETGGVAWRRQSGQARLAWTPFPKVRVSGQASDERLTVVSPFVSVSATGSPFLMEDRAQFLADGRFLLLGRADRTVKVGEKRISLPDLEERLRAHAAVADAALLLLPRRPQARIASVVVLTEEGLAILARQGTRAMTTALRHHLRLFCDPVLVPRHFRYVDRLPHDPQGKVPEAALRELFASPADRPETFPELLEEAGGADSLEQSLRVPARLACLEGHFPGFPVVPGVVQIEWVMNAARRAVGREVQLASLDALKFKGILRPGQAFRLRVDLPPGQDTLHFRLWNGTTVFASGRGRLRAPPGVQG